jgi:ABC-type polysaccharide/polyol phosphate export permease
MIALTHRQIVAAGEDLRAGVHDWRLSRLLAWQDIKQRYRRSTLGPIWLTLSTGIQMVTMGFLSSFLFGAPFEKQLPFVCSGMLFWGLITQMINDGAMVFISSSSYITQVRQPYTIYLLQIAWRNMMIFGHNVVIYILIAIIFVVVPSPGIVLWPLAVVLDLLCLAWMALIVGVIAARYRDIPMMIQSILNVFFWLTPVMYFPEQLGSKRYIADYNPFTHVLALLRDPLLGRTPTLNDWLVVLGMTIVGWVAAFLFFARFRVRIAYWL